ncbi:hypothetical protein BN1221_01829 [Brenneria goodwinii]|uniref:Uncharacterized protein n=1 Tax=Brenneria goodwinii TaxID=1109412 RepID=A0A0G4JUI0_9GAMM|nr:hypothetical protein BN1221_01829 [Brenneria goodwinii]
MSDKVGHDLASDLQARRLSIAAGAMYEYSFGFPGNTVFTLITIYHSEARREQ